MRTVGDLLSDHQHIIEAVWVEPGSRGIFAVTVAGEVQFTKHAEGRPATSSRTSTAGR